MLKKTFIHIPKIGEKTERHIWKKGILSWDEFLKNSCRAGFCKRKTDNIIEHLDLSIQHLKIRNIKFFNDTMPHTELWRLYSEFKDNAVFLDIETTGLYHYCNEISIIGLYDGRKVKTFVAGKNLNDFVDEINGYKLVITFNGTLFDLPFLNAQFYDFMPPVHIDLRFFLKKLGYSGGLKTIEGRFGIRRTGDIEGLDGYSAVILWNRYKRGDTDSLKLLIEYNTADIVNLKTLMDDGFEMMEKRLLKS